MIRRAVVLAVLVGGLAVVSAQTLVGQPQFDVASVKPNISGAIAQSSRIGSGSVTATNMRLRALIVTAFGITPDRILGLPSWTDRERFDINARAPAGTTDNQLRPMLRTLLEERFRLVARPEAREEPVYALVPARADKSLGPKLIPSSECDTTRVGAAAKGVGSSSDRLRSCTVFTGSNGRDAYITGGARSIAALVQALQGLSFQGVIDRPVLDQTGLAGTYDFDVRFAASSLEAAPADVPALPSIFTALQEQLGLKLEPARGQVEVLVIDRIERPTPD